MGPSLGGMGENFFTFCLLLFRQKCLILRINRGISWSIMSWMTNELGTMQVTSLVTAPTRVNTLIPCMENSYL